MHCSTRLLATISIGMLLATPSAAQLTDYVQLSATDGPGTSTYREALALCPSGTQAISGGATVLGTRSGTTLVGTRLAWEVDPPIGGWRAQATDDGVGSWSLRVDVICGVVAGHEVVSAITGAEGLSDRSLEVTCPDGKQLLGGGGFLTGTIWPIRFAYLTRFPPHGATPERWAANTWSGMPAPGAWGLGVEAICGFLPGRQVVDAYDDFEFATTRDSEVACPAGLVATGGGVEGIQGETTLLTSAPYGPASWGSAVRYEGSPSEPWGSVQTVICPEPGGAWLAFAAIAALRRRRSQRLWTQSRVLVEPIRLGRPA